MVELLWARVRDAKGDARERRHGPLVMAAAERCSESREGEPVVWALRRHNREGRGGSEIDVGDEQEERI